MEERYDKFKYFLEGYFNQTFRFDELEQLAKKFRELEHESNLDRLINELQVLHDREDWKYAQDFVYEHGGRYLPHDKLQAMFDLLIRELSTP